MRNPKILSLFFLLTILLTACSNTSQISIQPDRTMVNTTDDPVTSIEPAYPINKPEEYIGTIYPAGQEPTEMLPTTDMGGSIPEPQKTPEQDPETASIFGVLYSYTNKQPLQDVRVYAADVVTVEPSGGKVYTIQEKSSPQSNTDVNGQFMITGIEPGTYYFMMVTPFGNYPLFNEDNETFELELNGGDVINFGNVFVNWP